MKTCPFCNTETDFIESIIEIDESEQTLSTCPECKGSFLDANIGCERDLFAREWQTLADAQPEPGQKINLYYVNEDSSITGPVISQITHENSSHIHKGSYIYRPVAFWSAIPEAPNLV